jgi:hypothetical protein
VAYCTIIGQYEATPDNHDGIRLDSANSAWIHNNTIYGVQGEGHNSAGIKVYTSTNLLISDNYIYGNTTGIFDKDGGTLGNDTNQNTYTRNWITGNTGDQFLGNNQNDEALYYIYDNVVGGDLNLYTTNSGSEIYNNLILTTTTLDGNIAGIDGWQTLYQENIWNNITLSGGQSVWGYIATSVPFSTGSSTSPLSYMDYNVYNVTPAYDFNGTNYTLAQMQSSGFEQHSVVASDSSIFVNEVSYVLQPALQTAGRNGGPVGPTYPVAQIMNTGRYGAGALGTSPTITQQPQNQRVQTGGSATFSVTVNGSGLLYQWMTSTNGGSTWSVIQGATSASYTINNASSANNNQVFWCLVSGTGGSAWSTPATLTVSSSSPDIVVGNATVPAPPNPMASAKPTPNASVITSSSSASAISMGVLSSTQFNAGASSPIPAARAKAISGKPQGPAVQVPALHSKFTLAVAATSLERAAKLKSLGLLPGEQSR